VDVRYCASVMGIHDEKKGRRIVTAAPIGDDVVNLASALVEVFQDAGWNVPSEPMPSNQNGHGIGVKFGANASGHTKAAADAFVTALRQIILEVEDPEEEPREAWRRRPADDPPIEPPFGDETIVIDVLVHP
jgi:hypothetical protein